MAEANQWRNDCEYRVFSEHLNCTVNPVGGCAGCKDFCPRQLPETNFSREDYDRCAEEIGDVGDRLPSHPQIGQKTMAADWDGRIRPFIFNGIQWQPRLTRSQRILNFVNARWQVLWQVWSFAAAIALPLIAIGVDFDAALLFGVALYLNCLVFGSIKHLDMDWLLYLNREEFFVSIVGILFLMMFRVFRNGLLGQ
jgi:hypothetical protein